MKIRCFFVATLFGALTIFHTGASAKGVRYDIDDADNQAYFTKKISEQFDALIKAGVGEVIDLASLRAKVQSIRFVSRDHVYTLNNKNLTCQPSIHSQWLTAAYDSKEHRPTVIHLKMTKLREAGETDWLLYFHEAISSLGVVDDEYQVSGTLLALLELSQASGQRIPELLKDPNNQYLGKTLTLQMRTTAPVYNLDQNDLCWIFPEEGGRGRRVTRMQVAGTTSVGGGGYGLGVRFKADLVRGSRKWWIDHHSSEIGFSDFHAKVVAIGIEPYGLANDPLRIPAVIEHGISKRTKIPTAYISLEMLYREKLSAPNKAFLIPDENGDYSQHLCRDWCGAMDAIYRHLEKSK